MNAENTSKELLVQSYVTSIVRIQAALAGTLSIRNSREPTKPPKSTGEVVGLCGQRGRHAYFRIPIQALFDAINEIVQRVCGTGDTSTQVNALSSICHDLRRATYFDSGTGCVNDQVPSMVPLLPPEEIWFEGRELPLDVWRLISFEFDLVSTGVSAQLTVEDFAFGSVTQGSLAFGFLIKRLGNQRISFGVSAQGMPSAFSTILPAPSQITVPITRLFFEAGCLLTPLAEDRFARWYPAFRYLHWLSKSDLEFREDTVDSRYKGLFAEEMAIGLMAMVLGDTFNAKPINNTVEVLPPHVAIVGQPIADFVAQARHPLTSEKITIVAESKGSLGRVVSKARTTRAKEQVAQTSLVFSGSLITLPLAFCSTVYFSGQKQSTNCTAIDPPMEEHQEPMELDPQYAWRVAYAKALRFVGLDIASRQAAQGEPVEALKPMDVNQERRERKDERDHRRIRRSGLARERFGAQLLADMGDCAISIDTDVLRVLHNGIREGAHARLELVLDQRRHSYQMGHEALSFLSSIGIGCVFYIDLDDDERGSRV